MGCLCESCEPEPKKEPTAEEIEFNNKIKAKACEIIEAGTMPEFIYSVWQSKVKGNAYQGKALIVSRGAQSCSNTKGIHVWSQGKHGQGKSEGTDQMIDLMPEEWTVDTDPSPMNLYYQQDTILPGSTIGVDDIDSSTDLVKFLKKFTTRFQKGAQHDTVIKGQPVRLKMNPRINIWTSSVDVHGDEQFRDRFLFILIDETQTAAIMKFMQEQDMNPQNEDDRKFNVAVCKYLFADLADKLFHVDIPFSSYYNVALSQGTRGCAIFRDMVKGYAALRYAKRGRAHKAT